MTSVRHPKAHGLAIAMCVSVCALLAACGNPDGYYNADGRYTSYAVNGAANAPTRSTHDYNNNDYDILEPVHHQPYTADDYNRMSYYDVDGNYIGGAASLPVPQNMFPPRGRCRVWFADRTLNQQPGIETCRDIRSRVPAGAYVIYGG